MPIETAWTTRRPSGERMPTTAAGTVVGGTALTLAALAIHLDAPCPSDTALRSTRAGDLVELESRDGLVSAEALVADGRVVTIELVLTTTRRV